MLLLGVEVEVEVVLGPELVSVLEQEVGACVGDEVEVELEPELDLVLVVVSVVVVVVVASGVLVNVSFCLMSGVIMLFIFWRLCSW